MVAINLLKQQRGSFVFCNPSSPQLHGLRLTARQLALTPSTVVYPFWATNDGHIWPPDLLVARRRKRPTFWPKKPGIDGSAKKASDPNYRRLGVISPKWVVKSYGNFSPKNVRKNHSGLGIIVICPEWITKGVQICYKTSGCCTLFL